MKYLLFVLTNRKLKFVQALWKNKVIYIFGKYNHFNFMVKFLYQLFKKYNIYAILTILNFLFVLVYVKIIFKTFFLFPYKMMLK